MARDEIPRLDMDLYPRFSESEMRRRGAALDAAMAQHDVRHVVLLGANRTGSSIGWLTRWPVTREAVVIHTPGERDLLLVNFFNHVPNARQIATECDVRWAGERALEATIAELERRGAAGQRIGTIGSLDHRAHAGLSDFAEVVDMNAGYTRLRLIKSEEEIQWIRTAARMTDEALGALHEQARPGASETYLADVTERAYVAQGGTTHIHYLGSTSMTAPDLCVPRQYPSARRLGAGDVLVCELSASYWEYTGQILRTIAVDAEPTPLYQELHAVADAAFTAIKDRLTSGASAHGVVDAADLIEEAGFTIRDDLLHGFVGGYLPPVLGTRGRALAPTPEFTFERGMTVVVQPNVVTRDETAGVQTGELLLITDAGATRLHDYEQGLLRSPASSH
jgi:Xaa-Pro aminopeptidase